MADARQNPSIRKSVRNGKNLHLLYKLNSSSRLRLEIQVPDKKQPRLSDVQLMECFLSESIQISCILMNADRETPEACR